MRPGSMATSGRNLIVTLSREFPEVSSADSACIDRIWRTLSIIPSVNRKPDREVQVGTGGAHGNREREAVQTKLQRLLDRKQIGAVRGKAPFHRLNRSGDRISGHSLP